MPRLTNPFRVPSPISHHSFSAHSDQLAKMDSDKAAVTLFVSAIGPALQLGDVARTLGANAMPARLAKELLVPDLTAAVLSVDGWSGRLASRLCRQTGCERSAIRDGDRATTRIPSSQGMARSTGNMRPGMTHSTQLSDVVASPEWAKGNLGDSSATLSATVLERATRLEVDAIQASLPGVGPVTELEGSGAWAPRPGPAVRDLAVDHS